MPPAYQQLISDLMVLFGVLSAALSVIFVILALSQTRAPRGGALALVIGILLLAAGALSSTLPMTPHFVADAWQRVISPKAEPGPAPVPDPVDETPENTADPETEATP